MRNAGLDEAQAVPMGLEKEGRKMGAQEASRWGEIPETPARQDAQSLRG